MRAQRLGRTAHLDGGDARDDSLASSLRLGGEHLVAVPTQGHVHLHADEVLRLAVEAQHRRLRGRA